MKSKTIYLIVAVTCNLLTISPTLARGFGGVGYRGGYGGYDRVGYGGYDRAGYGYGGYDRAGYGYDRAAYAPAYGGVANGGAVYQNQNWNGVNNYGPGGAVVPVGAYGAPVAVDNGMAAVAGERAVPVDYNRLGRPLGFRR